jgi:hypothetical protein
MFLQIQWQARWYRDKQDGNHWNEVSLDQAENQDKEHIMEKNRKEHTGKLSKGSK